MSTTFTTSTTSTASAASTRSAGVPFTATPEDQALKAKHAAMWASGSYRSVAEDVVGPLGAILVETVDVQSGQCVLDVAAGTGTSALPSTRRGADVTATDLTPELLEVGRTAAAQEGLQLAGRPPTPRRCPTPRAASTRCCPASGSCSRPITSRPPTSSSGYAGPAGPSEC
jgi:hypothetical protein